MIRKTKVLFIIPYPLHTAPSQRFRVELFLPYLKNHNIEYTLAPFFDSLTYSVLYNNKSRFKKLLGVIKGFLRRFQLVFFKIHQYDYVFVHREASPLGPPFFEFLISKVFRKKLIYDYDDAIWIADSKHKLFNWLKSYWKIKWICRWAYRVVGGNEYLCNYAKQYNSNVVLIPTCVDVENHHNCLKDQNDMPITIGWTGSHTTLKYLNPLVPLLKKIAEENAVRFLVICNKRPEFIFNHLEFFEWNEATEIEDLLQIHIGIMPLTEDQWSQGKCGFKLIQYLSLGIPAVASPVGVNKIIIEEGVNGFLCSNDQQWQSALIRLIKEKKLRMEMGLAGRKKIINHYSVQAYERFFLSLFK